MTSQSDRLYNLLSDGLPHSTLEIMDKIYGDEHLGLARCGARIWDVKKKYNLEINGWHDPEKPTIYWYQAVLPQSDPKTPYKLNSGLTDGLHGPNGEDFWIVKEWQTVKEPEQGKLIEDCG